MTFLDDVKVVLFGQEVHSMEEAVELGVVKAMDQETHMHPAVKSVLQFFKYDHLPEHLQEPSKACTDLAEEMAADLPQNAELTVGLRKLLEAKDCFVRAKLWKDPSDA